MRRRTTILLACLAAALVAIFAAVRAAAPLLHPALGYVAKVSCSAVFLAGMTPAQAMHDMPDARIARFVRMRADEDAGRVRAWVPLVASREAELHPALGCRLDPVHGTATVLPLLPPLPAAMATTGDGLWPDGEIVEPARSDAFDGAALNAAIDRAFAEPDARGLRRTRAIVIVHDGRIIAERYADGFGPENRFAGWSMAKSVTGALVGVLAGAGRLDTAQSGLRPEWRDAGDERAAITLGQLLRMSSGLAFDESYAPMGEATRLLFASGDVAAAAAASPLAHAPGSTWSYSSATTNLVSHAVREAVPGTFADYLAFPRRALFDRIGMRSAVLEPDAAGTFVGSSFMYATARDWARFGLLQLRDGEWNGERILPDGWVSYSTSPAPAAPRGEFGAHWWLNAGAPADTTRRTWPRLPRDIFYAGGYQGQAIAVIPSHDLVIVRLGATLDGRAWSLGDFIADVLAARR